MRHSAGRKSCSGCGRNRRRRRLFGVVSSLEASSWWYSCASARAPSARGICGASWLLASTSCLASSTRRSGGHDFSFGILRVKTLHRPRPMPVMAALSVVAPLVGGITVEALHCKCWCSVCFVLSVSSSARLRLGGAWPWGRRGCRSGGSEFCLRLVAFEVFFGCRPWPLGWLGRRLVWCAASGPACSVVLYRFSAGFPHKLAISLLLYH